MADNSFKLIGHHNPFGRYPNIVIPIGRSSNGELIAFLSGDNGTIRVSDELTIVKHNKSNQNKLSNFDFEHDRLFAINKNLIEYYPVLNEKEFFEKKLQNLEFASTDPLFRLALAKNTQNIYSVLRETLSSLYYINSKTKKKKYLNKWYSTNLRSFSDYNLEFVLPEKLKFTQIPNSKLFIFDVLNYLMRLRKSYKRFSLDISRVERSIDESLGIYSAIADPEMYINFVYQVSVYYRITNEQNKCHTYFDHLYRLISSSKLHTVAESDDLESIASQYGVTLEELVDANPQLLKIGYQLTIPKTTPSTTEYDANSASSGEDGESSKSQKVHTVKVGDTLFGIALKYSTTVDAIMALNPQITNRNIVFEGQEIKIP